jgi:hypothetical protein
MVVMDLTFCHGAAFVSPKGEKTLDVDFERAGIN